MTPNTIDPAAVSAARERLAQQAQWLEDKLRTYSVTTLTLDGQDLEAMQTCVAALAARDEASEAMRALEELLRLSRDNQMLGGVVTIGNNRQSGVGYVISQSNHLLAAPTLPAAILALRQAVQQGDGSGTLQEKEEAEG